MDGFTIENYLRLSLTDVIMVMISTALIILIARKFFWSKLLAYVDKRQQIIQENIDSSARLKEQAKDLKNAYDKQMKTADQQARQLIDEARREASAEKKKILNEAGKEAALMKQKARDDIEKEKQATQKAMQEAIGDVAVDIAKKIVEKEIDADQQQKYIDDFIKEAGERSW